ncbi:hypothetical protein ACIGW7_11865 [Streptomyces sp. NPDC053253]|uniref:hypothetical protein n=1 Tax=Streptomyces sp. NPDC053253 TaxID=3365699 RepID=UPI0037D0B70C
MLANRLGGSGNTLDNLFTITQTPTNSPDMPHWEGVVYDAAKCGQVVTYDISLGHSDDLADSVPKYTQFEAFDRHDKLLFDKSLNDNTAHGRQQRHHRGLLP